MHNKRWAIQNDLSMTKYNLKYMERYKVSHSGHLITDWMYLYIFKLVKVLKRLHKWGTAGNISISIFQISNTSTK